MPDDRLNTVAPAPSLNVNVAKYQAMLDDPEMSGEDKRLYFEALWQIIVAFVDLGFGVHPVQQACGQLDEFAAETGAAFPDVVSSDHQPKDQFKNAAAKAGKDESG